MKTKPMKNTHTIDKLLLTLLLTVSVTSVGEPARLSVYRGVKNKH